MTREEHCCEGEDKGEDKDNSINKTIYVYKIGERAYFESVWLDWTHSVSIRYCPFCGVKL